MGVGFGRLEPGTAKGTHFGTYYHHTYAGETAPEGYDFAVTEEVGNSPLGAELGYRGGVASAKIPGAASSIAYTGELHLDLMFHGLGATASWGSESATFDGVDYSYGGIAAGGFAQMVVAPPLFLDIGLSRVLGSVDSGGTSVDAPGTRVSARLKFVAEWLGASLELRGTWADHVMVGPVDAAWSSVSLMVEAFYIKI